MSTGNLHDILLNRVAFMMRRLSESDARTLTAAMTSRINDVLSGNSYDHTQQYIPETLEFEKEIAEAIPIHLMNVATLAIPWKAFALAHHTPYATFNGQEQSMELLCSIPSVLEPAMRETLSSTGIWPGSILDCLAAVLSSAREEIVMISPYWSDAGVESIFRRITDHRFAGLRVVILTLPEAHHKSEALQALHNFRRRMVESGANCEIFSFPISHQWTPLLHAKSLVADSLHAYVGSANLTGNGMDASVEIGLSFHGAKAAHLRDWMMALSLQLEVW